MKNIKYFVGAVCLALSLNSCSDFLNEEPVSEIPAGDMWQTARDAKAGIMKSMDCYVPLYGRTISIGGSSVRIM